MLYQRVVRASALRATSMAASRRLPIIQQRTFLPDSFGNKKILDEKFPDYPTATDAEDPGMNGGFVNPPPVKRQFRDPHGDWWDKQERRNFGEPIHEDNDTLGIFTAYEYTWVNSRTAFAQIGTFIAAFLGVCWIVGRLYPDKPSYPREFEGGLERELGGAGAVRVSYPFWRSEYAQSNVVHTDRVLCRQELQEIQSHSNLRRQTNRSSTHILEKASVRYAQENTKNEISFVSLVHWLETLA